MRTARLLTVSCSIPRGRVFQSPQMQTPLDADPPRMLTPPCGQACGKITLSQICTGKDVCVCVCVIIYIIYIYNLMFGIVMYP